MLQLIFGNQDIQAFTTDAVKEAPILLVCGYIVGFVLTLSDTIILVLLPYRHIVSYLVMYLLVGQYVYVSLNSRV